MSHSHQPPPTQVPRRQNRANTVGVSILAAAVILGGAGEILAAPTGGNEAKASAHTSAPAVPLMLGDPISNKATASTTPTVSVLRQPTTQIPSPLITHPMTAMIAPVKPSAPISNQVITTAPPAVSVLSVLRQTTTQTLPSFLITYNPVTATTVPTISAATAVAACSDHVAECPAGPPDTATLASMVTNQFPTSTPPKLVWVLQWNDATCHPTGGPALPSGSTLTSYTCTYDIDIDATTGLYIDAYSY
jgi:hypothetical protein